MVICEILVISGLDVPNRLAVGTYDSQHFAGRFEFENKIRWSPAQREWKERPNIQSLVVHSSSRVTA